MKLLRKIILTFVMAIIGVLYIGGAEQVQAANSEIITKARADIDGDGKEELIEIRNIEEYDELYGAYVEKSALYINNKQKYIGYYDWNEGGYVNISFIDINSADKYIEIVVESIDAQEMREYHVFRYKKKKIQYLFGCQGFETNDKKDDTLNIYTSTNSRLGPCGIYREFKIKKGEAVQNGKKGTFKAAQPDYWYVASENIKIYKDANKKNQIGTIKSGEKFLVKKINIKYNKKEKEYTAHYAYIDTANKKNAGWIYIEGKASPWDGGFMVENYMWYC